MDFNILARMRHGLEVKHHIPGRIRIVFHGSLLTHPETRRFKDMKDDLPAAVKNVRINLLARSLVIEYDTRNIAPELLEELMTVVDDARAAEIAERLNESMW